MKIKFIHILLVILVIIFAMLIQNNEKMTNSPCEIDQNDMIEIMKIMQQLTITNEKKEEILNSKNPENYFLSQLYVNKINKLTSILKKYDYKAIKCMTDTNEMVKMQKKQFCNIETKNYIMKMLNFFEVLIDKYGFNAFLLFDHYSEVLQEFEKDCYKNNNPEIILKIKNIIRKLATIITVDNSLKNKLNYQNALL